MTRTEFVKAYAKRVGVSDEWAALGFIEYAKRVYIALPCECDWDGCEGWAMLSNENILDHLQFRAPEKLRAAYCEAVTGRGW